MQKTQFRETKKLDINQANSNIRRGLVKSHNLLNSTLPGKISVVGGSEGRLPAGGTESADTIDGQDLTRRGHNSGHSREMDLLMTFENKQL